MSEVWMLMIQVLVMTLPCWQTNIFRVPFFFFLNRISNVSDWPGTLCVAEDGLELLILLLPRARIAGITIPSSHMLETERRALCVLGKLSPN